MLDVIEGRLWRGLADGSGFAVALPAPDGPGQTRCVLLVEGWDAATAGEATACWGTGPAVAERPFLALGGDRAACILDAPPASQREGGGETILIRAPLPPDSSQVLPVRRPTRAPLSSASAAVLPRCLALPAAPDETPDPDLPGRVAADLAEGRLAEALAECAAAVMMLGSAGGGQATPVREAARTVLAHLARHPLARDPALGAFLGALLAATD